MTQQSNAEPGWYDGKYWDGQAWVPGAVPPPPRPESPWGYVLGGFGLAVVGVLAASVGISEDADAITAVGYLLAGLGGIMSTIGTIALGVHLGGRHLDYERRRRSS